MKNDYLLPVIKANGLYRVDRQGRVWTRKKLGGQVPHADTWRRAEVPSGSRGRPQVRHNGVLVYAARLVWFWFNGPIPAGHEIDHRDNDLANNRPRNLQPLTRLRNQQKAERDGLVTRGPSRARGPAIRAWWASPGRRAKMAQAASRGWAKRRQPTLA